jgi:predicted DNA binding CopG/RHH family protein
MVKLSREEKELMASVERGEWKSVPNAKKTITKHIKYARNTLRKSERITIRISQHDLEEIQTKALEEGLPYQTLITSVLHKYVDHRLVPA